MNKLSLIAPSLIIVLKCSIAFSADVSEFSVKFPIVCNENEIQALFESPVVLKEVTSKVAQKKTLRLFYQIYCGISSCSGFEIDVTNPDKSSGHPITPSAVSKTKVSENLYSFKFGAHRNWLLDLTKKTVRFVSNLDEDNHMMDVTVKCPN